MPSTVLICGVKGSGKTFLKQRLVLESCQFLEVPELLTIPSCDRILLVEAKPETIAQRIKGSDLPRIIAKIKTQRNMVDEFVERTHKPVLIIFGEVWEDDEVLKRIKAFLSSQEPDPTPVKSRLVFSQEVQASVYESAPEVQEDMRLYLEKELGPFRVAVNWDTWIGVYFTPARDEPQWTEDEFNKIVSMLEKHPNVMCLDVPESNREGMAKSTG